MKTPSKSQAPKPSHSYLYMRLLSEEGRDFGLGAIRKQAVNEGFGSVDSVDRACAWKVSRALLDVIISLIDLLGLPQGVSE